MVRIVSSPSRVATRPCAGMISTIPTSLRSVGIGYSRLLRISSSQLTPRRNCLALQGDCVVPADYPLAVIPCSSVVSLAAMADGDRVHSMPTLEEVGKMLPNDFSDLAETVALALFLSMQAAYKPHAALSSTPWFESQTDGTAKAPSNAQATALLHEMEEAVTAFHTTYAAHYNSPTLVSLLRFWRYVLSARIEMEDPSSFSVPSSSAEAGKDFAQRNDQASPQSCVVPLLDLVVARTGQPNVTLTLSTAKELRAVNLSKERTEVCDFFGCWQKLFECDDESRYFTLVTTRDVKGDDELCLEALPNRRSLFDEIRAGF